MNQLNASSHRAEGTNSRFSGVRDKVGQAVNLLVKPREYTVQDGDTLETVAMELGVDESMLKTNFLLGIKSIIGKTVVYNGKEVSIKGGATHFAARPAPVAANDERFALAA